MAEDLSRFREFRSAIESLGVSDRYDRSQLLIPRFRLGGEGRLDIYYAPFDHVNAQAQIALVGVTPGWTQMERSFVVARSLMDGGLDDHRILREVKRVAAFSGTLRRNLIAMLDGIDLSDALGVPSSATLFEPEGEDLLHSTSAIRYPVFSDGENYSGRNPLVTKSPLLTGYLDVLATELDALPQALVVPLGKAVESALALLVDTGRLDRARVLLGFPHPSGANPHRPRLYAESREAMSRTIEEWATSRGTTKPRRPASA